MVNTVTKGSLSHIWIYLKWPCLTNLRFKIRLLLTYITWTTLHQLAALRMSSWDEHELPTNLPFPRGTAPRWEMKNLFSASLPATVVVALCCLSGEQVVQKPVAGTKAHTAVTSMTVFPQDAGGRSFSPQMSQLTSNGASEHCAACVDLATITCHKNRC